MKIKDLIDLKKNVDVEQMVISCIKVFGSAKAEEVLQEIYAGDELANALVLLEKLDLMQDVTNEVIDVQDVEEIENESEEYIMKKQNKNTKAEVLDMHIDNDGIDAVQDTRVVVSDHGIDNRENNLEWWLLHAKNSEMKPVPFRDYLNHFDKGVYKGTVRNVYAYFKFGQRRFVVNVALEPIYSTAEHRGYVFESCPVFLSFNQFESICEELGWDFDDMDAMKGKQVNIVIDYNDATKSNTYFLQGK